MLTFEPIAAADPRIAAVLADLRAGQLREIAASRPGVTPAEIARDIAGLPETGVLHQLTLIAEDGTPRAVLIAVWLDGGRVNLAMVATRAWEGRIPVGLWRWFARVFLPGLDARPLDAQIVETIRFADTPPGADAWLRRLGFRVARTRHIHAARADRVTFLRLHPRLRPTPEKKAS